MSQQSAILCVALGVYVAIFALVEAIVSNTMTPWLEHLAGWPPPLEPRLSANLMQIPVAAYRPLWIRGVMVTTSGIVALPLALVALRLLVRGQRDE